MLKRIYHYQRLVISTMLKNGGAAAFSVAMIWGILFSFLSSAFGLSAGPLYFVEVILLFCSAEMAGNLNLPDRKLLPVSDRFAVMNLLFVFPLVMVGGTTLLVLAVMGFFCLVASLGVHSWSWVPHVFIKELDVTWLCGILTVILILVVLWFLLCIVSFHRSRRVRNVGYGCCAALYLGLSVGLVALLGHHGYHGTYYITDLPAIFPAGSCAYLCRCRGTMRIPCLSYLSQALSRRYSRATVKEHDEIFSDDRGLA